MEEYRLQNTGFLMNIKGSNGVTIKKLNTFDWLCDLPEAQAATEAIGYGDGATMELHGMLHDGEAETCATHLA